MASFASLFCVSPQQMEHTKPEFGKRIGVHFGNQYEHFDAVNKRVKDKQKRIWKDYTELGKVKEVNSNEYKYNVELLDQKCKDKNAVRQVLRRFIKRTNSWRNEGKMGFPPQREKREGTGYTRKRGSKTKVVCNKCERVCKSVLDWSNHNRYCSKQ